MVIVATPAKAHHVKWTKKKYTTNKSKPLNVIMMRTIWDVAFGSLPNAFCVHANQFLFFLPHTHTHTERWMRAQSISLYIAVVKLTTALLNNNHHHRACIFSCRLICSSLHRRVTFVVIFQLFWDFTLCDLAVCCWSSCRFNLLVYGRSMCDIWSDAWPCDIVLYFIFLRLLMPLVQCVVLILIPSFASFWSSSSWNRHNCENCLLSHLSLIYCL